MWIPKITCSILAKDMSLFVMQDKDYLAKCLPEINTDWTIAWIRQVVMKLESRKAMAKHMKTGSASPSQTSISQLNHQRLKFSEKSKKEETFP